MLVGEAEDRNLTVTVHNMAASAPVGATTGKKSMIRTRSPEPSSGRADFILESAILGDRVQPGWMSVRQVPLHILHSSAGLSVSCAGTSAAPVAPTVSALPIRGRGRG